MCLLREQAASLKCCGKLGEQLNGMLLKLRWEDVSSQAPQALVNVSFSATFPLYYPQPQPLPRSKLTMYYYTIEASRAHLKDHGVLI